MKKKIGILTLPLTRNFGGILQAYALQQYLIRRGFDAILLDRHLNENLIDQSKLFVKKLLFKSKYKAHEESLLISEKPRDFINKYITPKTEPLHSDGALKHIVNTLQLDAVVVGSDQVWRLKYLNDLVYNFFLDFLSETNLKKLSYAASFGEDYWKEDEETTATIKSYLEDFNFISVREDSGLNIINEHFNLKASHHLDPTMLLEPKDYVRLAEEEEEPNHNGELLVYMLDISADKQNVIDKIAGTTNYVPFLVNAKSAKPNASLNDRIYPTVTSWLRGFQNAKFVIADSFHGCVFSILFNKPFIAYGNVERGLTRFQSLFKMFGLEDRLILNASELKDSLIHKTIDWTTINELLKKYRAETDKYFDKI